MSNNSTASTTSTRMNETEVAQSLHDLVVCANLPSNQGMDMTVDHTGNYPVFVADGGTQRISSGQAFEALQRYLGNVRAEWKWADENLVFDDMTPETAAMLLNINYPVKGKNPRTVMALAYGLNKVRFTDRRVQRQARHAVLMAKAIEDGGAFFAEGVDGNGFPSEKKARKAWAREHFGADWWTEDKADRLSQAVVQRGAAFTSVSAETEKVRAVQSTPASTTIVETPTPVATTESIGLSDELIISMAQGAGSQAKTVDGAKAFLKSRGLVL